MALVPALVDGIRLPLRLAAPLGTMSANRRMARYFSDDPLIGASWKPIRFFRTVREFTPPSLKLHCPLLLVHPGADAWTPTPMSLATFDRIETRKQFVELSNGSHLPVEQPAYSELNEQVASFLAAATD
jgi:pimeloyl-ACP methyl ester carboxylesterase